MPEDMCSEIGVRDIITSYCAMVILFFVACIINKSTKHFKVVACSCTVLENSFSCN